MAEEADRTTPRARLRRLLARLRRTLPPGLRSLAGLGLLLGGLVGFLPVLGFWMIPLGLALIWFDAGALMRRLTGRKAAARDDDRAP